jgi:hypothetical protein
MALGANGKPFILGKMNTASAVSKLVKSGVGPALQLNVGSGPPLGVNSSTKVANLNADKVDGQEAATLLPGGELPSGRTLRGNYGIYDVAPENSVAWASDSISFGYRLPSEPTVRIIHTSGSGAGTPLCPGTASSPEAAPGYLCVYEKESEHILNSSYPDPSNVTRTGATLVAKNEVSSIRIFYKTYGTWAVTAP